MAFFASGKHVPEFTFGVGCSFRLWLRWETPSHSDCKFRDAFSESPTIRKARPTLTTSSERMRACCPGRPRLGVMENVTPNACHGAVPCQEKSLENFEAFTFVLFCTKDRERRSYSPKTAFLAAAAMLSRSSLVGWSFAATQLSSSILNRAFSGSCSSMAS